MRIDTITRRIAIIRKWPFITNYNKKAGMMKTQRPSVMRCFFPSFAMYILYLSTMMEINTEETSMQQLMLRLIINALSLAAAIKLITGISFVGEWWKIIGIAAVFGLINALIKPVIQLFTFPLIILTLGLFTLVINATMLAITAALSGPLHLGLQISGFWPALWGALVISLVSMVLSWVTGMNRS